MKELFNDIGKKKLLMILGGIVGLFIVVVIILLIYNGMIKKTSYKDIENKVLDASKKYYEANSSLLPKNENEEVSTTDSNLTAAGYLTSLSKLAKDKGVTCTATVTVTYNGGKYRYTPLLNCGDAYKTVTITNYIKEHESVVYTGDGLYELNGELVYRGEYPNNNITFAGNKWSIVKIENNKLVLILNVKGTKNVWDDRYNTDRVANDGINDYAVSRINEHLETLYNDETLFKKANKELLSLHNVYAGKRSKSDFYNDGSIEKSVVLENKYMSLLPLYDYINASLDDNCQSAETNSCANYNYLNKYNLTWWTATADNSTTYKSYRISTGGIIDAARDSGSGYIRPVIHLAKDALYLSGDGSVDKPYQVK